MYIYIFLCIGCYGYHNQLCTCIQHSERLKLYTIIGERSKNYMMDSGGSISILNKTLNPSSIHAHAFKSMHSKSNVYLLWIVHNSRNTMSPIFWLTVWLILCELNNKWFHCHLTSDCFLFSTCVCVNLMEIHGVRSRRACENDNSSMAVYTVVIIPRSRKVNWSLCMATFAQLINKEPRDVVIIVDDAIVWTAKIHTKQYFGVDCIELGATDTKSFTPINYGIQQYW